MKKFMGITEPATISSLKNKDRLVQFDASESSNGCSKSSRKSSSDKIMFPKDCIFCNKEGRKWHRKKGKGSASKKTTVFDMEGGKTVQEQAERKHDEKLLIRIREKCLFSVEFWRNYRLRKTM